MVGKTDLEILENVLEWDLKFLCPWKEGSDRMKPSKLFRACLFSLIILVLIMLSFVWFERQNLSSVTINENLAIAITLIRSIGYAVLVKKFYSEYRKQVDKLFDDRKAMPSDARELSMTGSCCRMEFRLTVAYHLNCYIITFVLIHAMGYFFPNSYQLPFNCYIIFLPPDGFLFAWELNYLVMTITDTFAGFAVASYLPLPFILMDQSCWLLDMALLTAEKMNEDLQADGDINDSERVAKTNESLKELTERCEKFVEWQNEVQDLLSWFFNIEFQVQAFILCLTIHVLTYAGGVVLLVACFCAVQTFVLCWMGTRVTSRVDKLSFDISKNWYLMPLTQRKTLQMILHWTQHMKGFSGVFKDVNLETCKAIFEAAYSFYTFLRSTTVD